MVEGRGVDDTEGAGSNAGSLPVQHSRPVRPVADANGSELHPRFWEGQLEAARRGSLAWGFAAFFLGYGGYYLVGLLLNALTAHSGQGFEPTAPPQTGPLLLLAFAPNVLLGLIPAVFSWWRGRGLRADYGILPTRRDWKVGLACGGLALLGAWVLALIIIGVSGPLPESELTRLMGGDRTIWLFLFALFAFLGAPLTEELLMRGALWGALEHYRIPRWAILVLTALVFALIHQEDWRLPVLFLGGIAMGVARMITGRVAASMIAHATNNFLPALLLFAVAG